MGFFRSILRFLGLSGEAQVRVRAPGIDIVILGDPRRVRWMLDAVKLELERNPRYRSLPDRARFRKLQSDPMNVVQPTELDEKDSPYAVPGAMVIPVRGRVEADGPLQAQPQPQPQPQHQHQPQAQSRAQSRAQSYAKEEVTDAPRRPLSDPLSEGSFEIAEEETPADFENVFGSEETVNDSRPDQRALLPRRLMPDVRPTEEIEAYTEGTVGRASSDGRPHDA